MDGPCLIDTAPEFFGVIWSRLRGGTLAVLSISSESVVTHFEICIPEVVFDSVKALERGLISILWIVKLLHSLLPQLSVEYCLLLVFILLIGWGFHCVWSFRPFARVLEVVCSRQSHGLLCKSLLDLFDVQVTLCLWTGFFTGFFAWSVHQTSDLPFLLLFWLLIFGSDEWLLHRCVWLYHFDTVRHFVFSKL